MRRGVRAALAQALTVEHGLAYPPPYAPEDGSVLARPADRHPSRLRASVLSGVRGEKCARLFIDIYKRCRGLRLKGAVACPKVVSVRFCAITFRRLVAFYKRHAIICSIGQLSTPTPHGGKEK
jgi:hypothetical protein